MSLMFRLPDPHQRVTRCLPPRRLSCRTSSPSSADQVAPLSSQPSSTRSPPRNRAARLMCARQKQDTDAATKTCAIVGGKETYTYKTNNKVRQASSVQTSCMPRKQQLTNSMVPESSSEIKFYWLSVKMYKIRNIY